MRANKQAVNIAPITLLLLVFGVFAVSQIFGNATQPVKAVLTLAVRNVTDDQDMGFVQSITDNGAASREHRFLVKVNDDSSSVNATSGASNDTLTINVANTTRSVSTSFSVMESSTEAKWDMYIQVEEQTNADNSLNGLTASRAKIIPAYEGDEIVVSYESLSKNLIVDNTGPNFASINPSYGSVTTVGNATFSADVTDAKSGFTSNAGEIDDFEAEHGKVSITISGMEIKKHHLTYTKITDGWNISLTTSLGTPGVNTDVPWKMKATDRAGNSTEIQGTLVVSGASLESAEEEEVFLINPGMTSEKKEITRFLGLPLEIAVTHLSGLSTSAAAQLLEGVPAERATAVLLQMPESDVSVIINAMSDTAAGAILEEVTLDKALQILEPIGMLKVASIIGAMTTPNATAIVGEIPSERATTIVESVKPGKAAELLSAVSLERRTTIVEAMTPGKLLERLPLVDPGKLFELPAETLFAKLPQVPTGHLTAEVAPVADPSLPAPVARAIAPGVVTYHISQTGKMTWSTLMETQLPVEGVLARFPKPRTNLSFTMVDRGTNRPSHAPDLPDNMVAGTYFFLNLPEVAPDDLSQAHVTFSVDKSWLAANTIHKWSVLLYRFDSQWSPFPTRRVREDDNRVYYTAPVPGFSLFAIAGSPELPPKRFEITNLDITPDAPEEGAPVSITAKVTNLTEHQHQYVANLWINQKVEATIPVEIPANGTEEISFALALPIGDYDVRLDQLLASFSVQQLGPTPAPLPSPTPVTLATPAPVPAVTPAPAPVPMPTATQVPPPTPSPTPLPTAAPTPDIAAEVANLVAATLAKTPTPTPPQPLETNAPFPRGLILVLLGIVLILGGAVAGLLFVRQRQW